MTSSVIITIVIVLGIIVAGGFLLYFCGDLLMGLAGKKKDATVVQEKQLKEQKALEARVRALENSEEARKDPDIATILNSGIVVEAYAPNEGKEKVEEKTEEVEVAPIVNVVEEVKEDEPAQEVKQEDSEEEDAAEFIRQRRAELMARLAKMQEEAEKEEAVEEPAAEEETVEIEETEEPSVEEEAEETPVQTVVEEKIVVMGGPLANMTLEELEARLTEEQERLKENEKDLRQCKKEYVPLRRVKKTLESDEKKLRRKEALVAKQKVVLYGVNNYADIDEEKAKKLAEDLDLLDGLKLSVQHCQEVMDKNQERYPLLEKIFNLLTAQNEEIKSDIKEVEEAIAKLKGDSEGTDAE